MIENKDYQIVQYMIRHAFQHGLEVEVILLFANKLRNGQKDLYIASRDALSECDI